VHFVIPTVNRDTWRLAFKWNVEGAGTYVDIPPRSNYRTHVYFSETAVRNFEKYTFTGSHRPGW
jgi:hypothetical protein